MYIVKNHALLQEKYFENSVLWETKNTHQEVDPPLLLLACCVPSVTWCTQGGGEEGGGGGRGLLIKCGKWVTLDTGNFYARMQTHFSGAFCSETWRWKTWRYMQTLQYVCTLTYRRAIDFEQTIPQEEHLGALNNENGRVVRNVVALPLSHTTRATEKERIESVACMRANWQRTGLYGYLRRRCLPSRPEQDWGMFANFKSFGPDQNDCWELWSCVKSLDKPTTNAVITKRRTTKGRNDITYIKFEEYYSILL